ncbi:competence protein ComFB [Ureibacillus xyleni]|uniref:Competence protein ComFB n=1 Tax=Ureibacillus xyleni TaxID=614648 RepID=A0A285TBN7_9BACL|nr:late competence development ComFB family protein [Ureibacillus xyleni]SOC18463.1 competence protein ComFB [Ureibacillus xyleni]
MPNLVNVTEEIVYGLVRFLLHGPEYQTFCHCESCELEITAHALNKMPSYYVTTNTARDEAFKRLKTPENIQQINRQIILSIYAVGKECNHNS